MSAARSVVRRYRTRLRRVVHHDLDAARLRAAGVRLGGKIVLEAGVWVDLEWGWLIEFGDHVTLSPRVMVFAHDAATRRALGHTRIAPVTVGARTYVGAGAIILPGVSIGADAIIGAGSIVSRDIPDATMAVGAPARVICTANDYLERRSADIDRGLVLGDIREERDLPDWATRREDLARRVRETGEAWVK